MDVYLVGGAVRDKLLGLPVIERDWVVVGATPQQLLSKNYQAVGRDFPVFLHPQTREEYALARIERKTGLGHTGFDCFAEPNVTLEEDLSRRDITINAIAEDPQGNLIDPFHGQEDIRHRTLRHVSSAFSEDPLRVLRVARFSARFAHLGFNVHSSTLKLMSEISQSGELELLTAERVWKETEKALLTESPHLYFKTLRECGALAVLFPELDALFGIPAPEKWHPEIDTGLHILLSLEASAKLTSDITVHFAVLCHDFGKALTPRTLWPSHPGHGAAGKKIIKTLCERFKIPSALCESAQVFAEFHDYVHKLPHLPAESILKLLNGIDVWRKPERLKQLLQVSEADFKGRKNWQNRPYPQAELCQQALEYVKQISTKEIIQGGFKNAGITQELQRRRKEVLQNWLELWIVKKR